MMEPEVAQAIIAYQSPVPLFDSGEAAARHGRAEIDDPGTDAQKLLDKIVKRGRVG